MKLLLEEIKEMKPATQPIMDGQLQAVGVNITDRVVVKLTSYYASELLN